MEQDRFLPEKENENLYQKPPKKKNIERKKKECHEGVVPLVVSC